jgi:hypothetical protein
MAARLPTRRVEPKGDVMCLLPTPACSTTPTISRTVAPVSSQHDATVDYVLEVDHVVELSPSYFFVCPTTLPED